MAGSGAVVTLAELWEYIQQYILTGPNAAILVILLSLVEISPIKINPWAWFFGWVGQKLTGSLRNELNDLKKDIEHVNKKVSEVRDEAVRSDVANMRWFILSFAQDCRDGVTHSKEQWTHALNQSKYYESYCREHAVQNGVIEEDTKFIRDLYAELSREHKI